MATAEFSKFAGILSGAVANWEAKNQDNVKELENGNVIVKTIMVDEGRTLKRIRPCPQGRAGSTLTRSKGVIRSV